MMGGRDALITVHTISPRFFHFRWKQETGHSWVSFFFFKDNLYVAYFTHVVINRHYLVGFDHESVDHLFARFHEESLVSLIQK